MDDHLVSVIIYFVKSFVGLGLASTVAEPDAQGNLLSKVYLVACGSKCWQRYITCVSLFLSSLCVRDESGQYICGVCGKRSHNLL